MENRHENPDSTLVPAVLVLEGGATRGVFNIRSAGLSDGERVLHD